MLEPAFTSKFLKVAVPRGTAGWVDADEAMTFVNARIAAQPYIAGETFTAADALYAGTFALFMNSPLWARTRRRPSRITSPAASRGRRTHGQRRRIRILFERRSETSGVHFAAPEKPELMLEALRAFLSAISGEQPLKAESPSPRLVASR